MTYYVLSGTLNLTKPKPRGAQASLVSRFFSRAPDISWRAVWAPLQILRTYGDTSRVLGYLGSDSAVLGFLIVV